MSTSKKKISDAVLYKLAGGIPDSGFPIDERDIWKSLEDKVNALFKLRHFDTTLPSGETIPESTMIATYTGITVTANANNNTSYATLPITPISLPKNVGVFLVYDEDYPDFPFIPLQRGQKALLRTDELLNDVLGLIAYEPKNNRIVFNKDITLLGVTEVTMELCVFDISQYTATADLPIPADYEAQIEDELIKEFIWVNPEAAIVNNFTNANQLPAK
jgi:hypothetical protein